MANSAQLLKLFKDMSKKTSGTGMKDDVPAQIDGQQPAALSEGEYVVPSDVVAMLGDGNTEAGVKILDGAIERLRAAKQAKPKEQGKPLAELFKGGKV